MNQVELSSNTDNCSQSHNRHVTKSDSFPALQYRVGEKEFLGLPKLQGALYHCPVDACS